MMRPVTIKGHLKRDPMVSRYCGMVFAMFRLVPDEPRQDEGIQSIREYYVFAFDKEAEYVERYMRKKSKVLVVADMDDDHASGEPNRQGRVVNVTATEIQLIGDSGIVPAEPLKYSGLGRLESRVRNTDAERLSRGNEQNAYVSMDGFFDNL